MPKGTKEATDNMPRPPRRIAIELTEAVSDRVEKLAGAPDSPYSVEAIRARLRARLSEKASYLANEELANLEKNIA